MNHSRSAKLTNRFIKGSWWGRDASSDEHLVGWNMVCISADQFAENFMESNGVDGKRLKLEGTKWNFDVEMDPGMPGRTLQPRRDEGMPTATAPIEIPTVPPEGQVPEMRGQGVHAKTLRIRAFRSGTGRSPGCQACDTPVQGSHTPVNAESLEIQTHDRWTQVRAQQIPTRRDQFCDRKRELGEPNGWG